ncbi:mechanosensitive ion channel family protein [Anthocerotibacter panamensis]|uniref:mechanosensitive ion channel family protein n=1 Tax=Anthocerotibacter panamensis TaxID=2857077 RepID=UPI001C404032|nr:mechanosensitive ion channel family protein [Anthocerotibacter panamensis]
MEHLNFLQTPWYGNSLLSWLLAATLTVVLAVVLPFIKAKVTVRLAKFAQDSSTDLDDLMVQLLVKSKGITLLVLAVYGGSLILTLPRDVARLVEGGLVVTFFFQVGLWGNALVDYGMGRYQRSEEGEEAATALGTLVFLGRLLLWTVVLLLGLANLGFDITALVASLGIGGIAIGLAVQNILGDLFASLSIVLDKPFKVGDFIIVGDLMGTVEHVGLKTTRVRSLFGEQLVFSNNELIQSRIRNFASMQERRVTFGISVTYQTPAAQVARIPTMVREIIENQAQVRFDRAHFKEFGASSLDFEIVYYALSGDYNIYMDIQQAINLAIYEHFEAEAIDFAYPTQTLFLERTASRDS